MKTTINESQAGIPADTKRARASDPQAGAVSLLHWLRRLVPPLLVLATLVIAWIELQGFDFAALRESVRQVPIPTLLGLQALALVAVLEMAAYDWWVSRRLQVSVPHDRLLRYSWVANTTNNLIGLSGLAGSGVRILLLTRDGVPARTAALYAGIIMLAVPVGLSVLVLVALMAGHGDLLPQALPGWALHAVLVAYGAYLPGFLVLAQSRTLLRRVLHSDARLGWAGGLALVGISVLDWVLAVAVAWSCLLAAGAQVDLGTFAAAFAFAATLGILSLIPGGLGVFDGSLLVMLSAAGTSAESALAGLLLFRLVYYLVPWLIGVYLGSALIGEGAALGLTGVARRWQNSPLLGLLRLPVGFLAGLGVRLLGLLTFGTGVVLLIAAALPAVEDRVELMLRVLPLHALELSHLLTVGIGVLLIALSRGIGQQVRGAYLVAMPLLLAGAGLSLLKGVDLEASLFLLAVAGLLRIRRDAFYRLSYPLFGRRSALWLLALAGSVVGYGLLGAWVHGEEVGDVGLWLQADPYLHVARYLRSLPVVVLVPIAWLAWGFFRMPRPDLSPPDRPGLVQARDWLETHGGGSFAHLAFMGDKHLLYAAGGRALMLVGRMRNRLVALGDPMGAPEALGRAVGELRDLADRYDLDPVFYEVSDAHLHIYHDAGFALFKIGEMGMVRVEDFKLSGKRNDNLRHGVNRAKRAGVSIELLEHPLDEQVWTELKGVSDAWLTERGSAEKGFSLGAFDRDYLAWSPIFVVRHADAIVAFASLMPAYQGGEELSIDLMRHLPEAPAGTMDYLFAELIEHARQGGYRWFNLGMAPLSGVGQTRFARPHERLAGLAYDYGNRLYNYKGLRSFKEKFHPQWRGRYIAYPLFTPLPTVLVDIAALIAGGYRQILVRP
ncbi:MAG: bifunctional lysylphosphatidylglycerol flippase/synthetase MprF [Bdellovibrio bacteriovorus]